LMTEINGSRVTPYPVEGYVCGLNETSDLRQLVMDAFLSRCSVRPRGREVRPGVWLDEGTQVHRRAQITGPAYVGRGAMLRANTQLSDFSTLERGCIVDEGTVIEASTVLMNTFVGRGLNVFQSIVDGNHLHPLRQNVVVEIRDQRLLGRTVPSEPVRVASGGAGASLAERLLATAWN